VINADNTGEIIPFKDQPFMGKFFYDPANDQLKASIKIRDNNFYPKRSPYDFHFSR